MKINKFIEYFLPIVLIVNFSIFNKATAQLQSSNLFSGAVKRDVAPSNLPKTNFIFNPTVQTLPNSPTSPNGINTITDGQDIRIFPSANVQAEVHISINKLNPNNLVASANTYLTRGMEQTNCKIILEYYGEIHQLHSALMAERI